MAAVYNGYVSKYINRRLSNPVAALLARTWITPNQVSWAAFCVALLSFFSFFFGWNIAGGLLAQLSSIVDGVDGTLARLKNSVSAFGGFLDSMLDRYADIVIVLGLTMWSVSNEVYPGIWPVGLVAIAGTICVSYSRARIGVEQRHLFDRGVQSLASRDIRLLLIMIGGVAGQAYFCLIAIAALTNLIVFHRILLAFRNLRSG